MFLRAGLPRVDTTFAKSKRANKAVLDFRRLLEWRIPSMIEVGAQRPILEQRLPDPRCQFHDTLCQMLANPLQNINQTGLRRSTIWAEALRRGDPVLLR